VVFPFGTSTVTRSTGSHSLLRLTMAQSRTHASLFSYPRSKMQMQQNEINAFSISM
jgi:hypothetical protein